MQLYSLLYTSAETEPLTEIELKSLLEQARNYNLRKNITGMLLHHKNSFLQLLEGDKHIIEDLFRLKISKDKRHTAITEYFLSPIDQRTFPEWSMGFHIVQQEDFKHIEGYSEFLDKGFDSNLLKQGPTVAKQILLMFAGRIPPI